MLADAVAFQADGMCPLPYLTDAAQCLSDGDQARPAYWHRVSRGDPAFQRAS